MKVRAILLFLSWLPGMFFMESGLAQTSELCGNLNSYSPPDPFFGVTFFSQDVLAGDRVVAITANPIGATTLSFTVDGSAVASGGIPGTLEYQFSADGTFEFGIIPDAGESDISLTCTNEPLPSPTPTATSVPVMPFWMLGLIIVTVAGIGASRINRDR